DAHPQRPDRVEENIGVSAHPQFAEDLALYALGALDATQCPTLEKHLEECAACRNELAALRGDAGLLALSVSGPAAPQRSPARRRRGGERVPRRGAGEPHPVRVRMRRPWWSFAPVAAAALLAIFCVLLLEDNLELRRRVDDLKTQVGVSEHQLAESKMVLDAM